MSEDNYMKKLHKQVELAYNQAHDREQNQKKYKHEEVKNSQSLAAFVTLKQQKKIVGKKIRAQSAVKQVNINSEQQK